MFSNDYKIWEYFKCFRGHNLRRVLIEESWTNFIIKFWVDHAQEINFWIHLYSLDSHREEDVWLPCSVVLLVFFSCPHWLRSLPSLPTPTTPSMPSHTLLLFLLSHISLSLEFETISRGCCQGRFVNCRQISPKLKRSFIRIRFSSSIIISFPQFPRRNLVSSRYLWTCRHLSHSQWR